MRIEQREDKLCVVAESDQDNQSMRSLGADGDRQRLHVHVSRDEEVQHSGETPFEPIVLEISCLGDELDIEFV
jgi:hypothetical protein